MCSSAGASARHIVIAGYDPAWPERFAAEWDRIAAALGPLALRIDKWSDMNHYAEAKSALIAEILTRAAPVANNPTQVP
jgi:GrpB-like predicted nucleotidyltransferase (UPF0157 family)